VRQTAERERREKREERGRRRREASTEKTKGEHEVPKLSTTVFARQH
jgi:hypothetical protein